MKRIKALLLFSAMCLSLGGCGEEEKPVEPKQVDVVVISGQSNAVGCTHSSSITMSIGHSKYQEYMAGYPSIQIAFDSWTKDGEYFYSQNHSKDDTFMKVMLGQGNSLATFGPEIGIAEGAHEKRGDKLFIIKYACGASNLKDDWTKRDSPMYGRFVAYVKKQMENLTKLGYAPTIKAFCWMQGEGDAYPGYHDKYYENIKFFVTNVREDLKSLAGDKEIPFIDAGISGTINPDTHKPVWEFYKEVNEAKKQFAAESNNNFYIDTIEAGMHTNEEPAGEPDLCHYDTESEILLGHLFLEQFEPFLMSLE